MMFALKIVFCVLLCLPLAYGVKFLFKNLIENAKKSN